MKFSIKFNLCIFLIWGEPSTKFFHVMRIFQCEKAHNFLQTIPKEGILVTVLTIHMKKGKLIFLGMKDVPTRRRKYVDTIAMLVLEQKGTKGSG